MWIRVVSGEVATFGGSVVGPSLEWQHVLDVRQAGSHLNYDSMQPFAFRSAVGEAYVALPAVVPGVVDVQGYVPHPTDVVY